MSRADKVIFNGIIGLLASGEVSQTRIASQLNFDVGVIRRIMASETFKEYFQGKDKKTYLLWKGQESEKARKEVVKTALASDLPDFYQELKRLIVESPDVPDRDRGNWILSLLKASEALEGGQEEGTISLNPTHLASLKEALGDITQ